MKFIKVGYISLESSMSVKPLVPSTVVVWSLAKSC